jgi:hypothetical protein
MLGIECPDRHALLRIAPTKPHRPRRVLPSRASGFVPRRYRDIRPIVGNGRNWQAKRSFAKISSAIRLAGGDVLRESGEGGTEEACQGPPDILNFVSLRYPLNLDRVGTILLPQALAGLIHECRIKGRRASHSRASGA